MLLCSGGAESLVYVFRSVRTRNANEEMRATCRVERSLSLVSLAIALSLCDGGKSYGMCMCLVSCDLYIYIYIYAKHVVGDRQILATHAKLNTPSRMELSCLGIYIE